LLFTVLLSACQRDEAQMMFDSGMSLWKEQKYDEAIQNLIALTKAYPNNALVDDSLFWIASIYEHYLKEPDQAVRFYLSLNNKFERSEYNTRSMLGLARVRALQGDEGKRKAIRILKKLQKQNDPGFDEESWQQNQLQLAQLLFDLKNYQDTRIELKRLIYAFPNSVYLPLAYYKIGKSFREEGNLELAILTFLETDKKFGHQRKTLSSALSLADIYEETGELNEAIGVYESVLRRLEEKEVFYQLATNRIETLRQRVKKTKTG
jgi:TolA-binding protein